MEHEGDGDTNCCWCTWIGPQRLGNGSETVGNQRNNLEHQDYDIDGVG